MSRKARKGSAADDLDIPETPPGFFKRGVMGKYYDEYVRSGRKPVRAITLEEDVAAVFKDSHSVNSVLRAIIKSLPHLSAVKRRKSA